MMPPAPPRKIEVPLSILSCNRCYDFWPLMTGMHPRHQIKKIDVSSSMLNCNRCYKICVCMRVDIKKQFVVHCKLAVKSYKCSSPACHMSAALTCSSWKKSNKMLLSSITKSESVWQSPVGFYPGT